MGLPHSLNGGGAYPAIAAENRDAAQLSGRGNHAVGKTGNILTGNSRHLHGDILIKGEVLQNGFWIGETGVKVVQSNRRHPGFFDQIHQLGEADGGHADMVSLSSRR